MEKSIIEKTAPVFAFLSALLFSFGGLIIKISPWQPLSINAARNLVAAVITFIWLRSSGHKIVLNRATVLGAVCMTATTTLFCMANKMTTAANTILLQFTSPVFVILFSWIFWKQRPVKRELIMCVVVFFGICLCFGDSLASGYILGDLLALASGVTYAVVFMCGRMEGGDPPSAFLFGELLSCLVCAPSLFGESDFSATPLICGAVLGLILGAGYVFLSIALKYVAPVQANLVSAVEPVLNPIWVAIFYNETITGAALIGFIIVLGGVVVSGLPAKTPRGETL